MLVHVPHFVLDEADADAQHHHRVKDFRPVGVNIPRSEDGEVLLARSAKGKRRWGLFQGGIEEGETPLEGAVRELWEEAGIRVRSALDLCLVAQLKNRKRPSNGFSEGARYYYFHVLCDGGARITLKQDEVCDYLWLPPQDALHFIAKSNVRRDRRPSMLRALRIALHL